MGNYRSLGFNNASNTLHSPETNVAEHPNSREVLPYQPMTRHLRSTSSFGLSPTQQVSPPSQPAVPFNPREAVLIRNFAENMALWVGVRPSAIWRQLLK